MSPTEKDMSQQNNFEGYALSTPLEESHLQGEIHSFITQHWNVKVKLHVQYIVSLKAIKI